MKIISLNQPGRRGTIIKYGLIIKVLSITGLLFFLGACSKKDKCPDNAKLIGDKWISCTAVKRGMYQCRFFSKEDKKLLNEKIFIYPYFYRPLEDNDLSAKLTGYDGNAVYFDGNKKLIACDIPKEAVLIQGIKDGVWVTCKPLDYSQNSYICTAYSNKNGNVMSTGVYTLKRYFWDHKLRKMKYYDIKDAADPMKFFYYGGVGISLRNKMVLLPDGWIEYPEGPRSGVRVLYNKDGKVLREEAL